jgi:hypothetical protein
MTPFKDITPGIWEAKRANREGDYNMLVKVYGIYPFFEVSTWDYTVSKKGMQADNIGVGDIDKLEFGNKIKEIEG